jgi:hypothetical protein
MTMRDWLLTILLGGLSWIVVHTLISYFWR